MKPIDVLGDDSGELLAVLELDDGHVPEGGAGEVERERLEFVGAALG